jgi:hypothetical protein
MGSHDGSSLRDFGRSLGHREGAFVPREALREARRFDRLEVGNGARVGFGFVQGRHLGLRFGKSF